MREPEGVSMGWSAEGYQAHCSNCGTTVVVEGTGIGPPTGLLPEERTLSMALLFYYTLEKLRRECDCEDQKI